MRIIIWGAFALLPSSVFAQAWNDPAALARVTRAVERRNAVQGDSSLRSWQVRAHGVVLFQAQLGETPDAPTRLIKADELDVEVYWQTPGRSKQVIRHWRDRRYLPTDIRYHRDHLGIVTDGFGPKIRIGGGDEVRDVVHPLSMEGLALYEYALTDSAVIARATGTVIVDAIAVRPRDPGGAAVVGMLYLDRASAELARARLSFTPAAYVDGSIEALTVVLDYALIDDVAWLPWRQAIEIRRNTGWLELPYRGVIRGSWEFGEYQLGHAIPETTFRGLPIGGLGVPRNDDSAWAGPMEGVLADAGPLATESDLEAARAEVARVVEGRGVARAAEVRGAANGVSGLVRFNRVQGVALGFGVVGRGSWVTLKPRIGLGLSDGRLTGGLTASFTTHDARRTTYELFADRAIRDFSDQPIISGALNSLTAQEGGDDHGDYVLIERAGVRLSLPLTRTHRLTTTLARLDAASVGISAAPARGTFRPQQEFGGPPTWTGAIEVRHVRNGSGEGFGWGVDLGGGSGQTRWGRVTADLDGELPFVGSSTIGLRAYGGAGTEHLPAWRSFVLGGRGTLLGEGFRAWGGRQMAWGSLEWRVPVPMPAVGLGDFASTGRTAIVAPFVAVGWAAAPVAGLPWGATGDPRLTTGAALELFYKLVRIEGGVSLQTGEIGVTFDVGRVWWGML